MELTGTLRVLLIEDDESFATLLRHFLTEDGDITVDTCATLRAASAYLARKTVDVIILDLRLPDADPENTVKLIPSLSKRGTVIILSGHLNSEIEALAREAGAYAALEKSSKQHMGRVQIKHFVQRAGEVQRRNAILDEATGYLDRATDRLTQLGKVFEQGV